MPWVRFDDQFPINRKVGALPDTAFRLHVEAVCWCARNLTDGVVSTTDLPQVTRMGKPTRLVTHLVDRGLWHEAGHQCDSPHCPPPGPDGWVIHDYLEYQPSRAKVERERKAKADRQARWLAKKNGLSTSSGQRDASQDAPTDTSKDAAPPRPAPKEAGREPRSTAARRSAAERGGGGESNRRTSPVCDECGNTVASAYHRNACTKGAP